MAVFIALAIENLGDRGPEKIWPVEFPDETTIGEVMEWLETHPNVWELKLSTMSKP